MERFDSRPVMSSFLPVKKPMGVLLWNAGHWRCRPRQEPLRAGLGPRPPGARGYETVCGRRQNRLWLRAELSHAVLADFLADGVRCSGPGRAWLCAVGRPEIPARVCPFRLCEPGGPQGRRTAHGEQPALLHL